MKTGNCKLTKKTGQFVKSHLLPKALTNLHKSKKPRIQVDFKGQIDTVHDGWYDHNLCTKDGEDILAELDTYGIDELREHHLIWDSWGLSNKLSETTASGLQLDSNEEGLRILKFTEPLKIKLFFLSLLWRTAASDRKEMEEISISSEEIEILRLIIAENRRDLIDKFPITLVQLSTKGPVHNRTPYITEFDVEFNGSPKKITQVRIYFDGLIVRITLNATKDDITFVDSNDGTSTIVCKNFENSYQNSEMSELFESNKNPSYLFEKCPINNAINYLISNK